VVLIPVEWSGYSMYLSNWRLSPFRVRNTSVDVEKAMKNVQIIEQEFFPFRTSSPLKCALPDNYQNPLINGQGRERVGSLPRRLATYKMSVS
jgi:hypothetical protein